MKTMKIDARDLFARALDLDGEARDSFLDEACGGDAELRLEVVRMLVESEKADDFFSDGDQTALLARDFETPYSETEGDRVGPYILRQQIGEGGFGMVWMAEQSEPISRMVALKVVKAGMDTRHVLARFEAERQALAMMEHPNIAKILEAGMTAGGRPYFAMELVKGVPITDFCNDQNYDHRRRLELFRDVCSAVNHAHQKGIIHRDIKPSNVMVTLHGDGPVVKVIDFGIAKAIHSKLTEKTLFTRFEQFLGTPVYMSPEQAAMSGLDIDTRADIYCLGVLLYELLAGAPPFDKTSLLSAGYDEMRRIIREQEPPKPSKRLTQTLAESPADSTERLQVSATALKGELDWIVMKAIEKDRTRRYDSASTFSADIDRYLADEPVQAAAPGTVYLFRKFARRHKTAIGVAAAMVVLLVAGTVVSVWQAMRAIEAEVMGAKTITSLQAERSAKERALEEAEEFADFLKKTLEAQLLGYWAVDGEETAELSRQEPEPARSGRRVPPKTESFGSASALAEAIAEELEEELMRRLVFEFREDEVIVHAPGSGEVVSSEFSLQSPDKAGNSLTMKVPGEDGSEEVTIERDRLVLRRDEGIMVFKRISKEEFEKRQAEELRAGENKAGIVRDKTNAGDGK